MITMTIQVGKQVKIEIITLLEFLFCVITSNFSQSNLLQKSIFTFVDIFMHDFCPEILCFYLTRHSLFRSYSAIAHLKKKKTCARTQKVMAHNLMTL